MACPVVCSGSNMVTSVLGNNDDWIDFIWLEEVIFCEWHYTRLVQFSCAVNAQLHYFCSKTLSVVGVTYAIPSLLYQTLRKDYQYCITVALGKLFLNNLIWKSTIPLQSNSHRQTHVTRMRCECQRRAFDLFPFFSFLCWRAAGGWTWEGQQQSISIALLVFTKG